ncbi:FtsP/CotA-like multicopper oxidase with cupredoxin domain [Microterricola gilva]|uniref:FtsP/CotA-like multicopper oxidase with cupredoxin domain n=1 Tax=Microterricola gilva TaxID=393267 RepID=A0A4Q8AQM1_9MICO|nr:multicopper oxidase family protein [Microterricola gilva]RZU66375.1 FtsP/CotA-like multicopper oxidase with cupredoxin domain [Microterricola gilva]
MPSRREVFRRVLLGAALTTALLAAFVAWQGTLLGEYSVMEMGGSAGHSDHAGHAVPASAALDGPAAGGTSVTALTADADRPADVRVELVARQERIDVPGGRPVDGYTVNGQSPGPVIRARQGELVEVVFINESVAAGATLHWHGIDVPNAADGVAGITQDAVPVGGRYVYRFVAADAGTYWYHSHQLSHEQVQRGLLGAVVIEPGDAAPDAATELIALLHLYGSQHTLNGRVADERVPASPGQEVRVRVINTDQGTAAVWSADPFRVVAVDGHEVSEPGEVTDRTLLIPAGGRADVSMLAPEQGAAQLRVGGARSVLIGDVADGAAVTEPVRQPAERLDLLSYGAPVPLGIDPSRPDRVYDYVIARRYGIIDGRPGNFWTINGRMFPDVPMFAVSEGDVVVMRIRNDSGDVHPMHLHGHHALVLSRDGVAACGSPWWVDTLDVRPHESYEIAFVADNPGIWSDHCHTLQHAVDGLITHVMYDGVTTPFTINGDAGNHPE